ncbi:CMP-N,N'-diacetyllegionaminic acid synthase [Peptoclostridium litorale DSM 5388]|uniref:CMP-N,N'-diacetyllegionaminic acid synthase NeuA n=1 Tax=Peptoclostridium litorale DSM 5388 TaxID=1121324 RepID=A0A069RCL6_PEPLI|nr:acylneuraminate cytidylyltransferase family protein [Peptoclostridium litorale]KDR94766.1 CMP-N,N'-diacetyllegionaminic acid synthase NeuA [Peptoclostridium litorale DSM 5388]SIN92216.1 CMP-N,N'-diacetyllegionaminic acid synthase [Peptoclostridium litorale DSM 5388]
MDKNILAIIPARGGSKRIPQKNLKLLKGKPLIAHTIEECKKSKYIDKIVVSTEDLEIARISELYGAEVPVLRPNELAADEILGIDPIIHMIKWIEDNENYKADYVICLQCTSPFRSAKHIDEAVKKLLESGHDSIVSISECQENPHWMKKMENGIMKDFMENSRFYSRSQELPKIYKLNGAIYMAKTEVILENRNWYTENTIPYVMEKIHSLDIDEPMDFKFAEFLMGSDFEF